MGVFAPAFSAHAQTAVTSNIETQDYETALGACDIFGGNWTPCFLGIVDLFVQLTAWFARITAQILDFFISFSISSSSYQNSNSTFVERGWSIIRDIANVSFIFMLLYIAIKHILQAGSSETKKLLKSLIVAALLINFSLFFCKIIIDAGNILARAFYNNIEMVNDDNPDYKDISVGIVEKVQPQKLFSVNFFKQVPAPGRPSNQPSYGWIFVMQVITIAVNIIMALMFLSTFLLFAARVIGLWLLMIFSPIAFVSLALPNSGEMLGELGWSKWLKQMTSLSFMAPVFLFFLFLLVMFLEIAFTPSTPLASQDTAQALMGVFVPFIVVVLIMRIAKERAKDMAGKVGEMTTKAVGSALGYAAGAAGLAFGGAAIAGRLTAGRLANVAVKSKSFQDAASRNKFARGLYKFTDATAKSSLDVRNSETTRKTLGLLSKGLAGAGISSSLDLGKGTTRGGYAQRLDEYKKKKLEFKSKLESSDSTKFTTEYKDAAGNMKQITTSVMSAETEFLKAQNEAKRKDVTQFVTNAETGAMEQFTGDHDAWVKAKEATDKKKTQADTNYAIAQRNAKRNPDGSIDMTDRGVIDAKKKLDDASERQKQFKDFIEDIEKGWKVEERIFKGIKRQQAIRDTEMGRAYSKSVKGNALSWVYDVARGENPSARKSASKNLALAAEKEEKKAQAEAKKEDKK